jgi:hypothetical protein
MYSDMYAIILAIPVADDHYYAQAMFHSLLDNHYLRRVTELCNGSATFSIPANESQGLTSFFKSHAQRGGAALSF